MITIYDLADVEIDGTDDGFTYAHGHIPADEFIEVAKVLGYDLAESDVEYTYMRITPCRQPNGFYDLRVTTAAGPARGAFKATYFSW